MNHQSDNPDARIGRGMIWLAAIGLLAALTFGFQAFMPKRGGLVDSSIIDGRAQVVLRQDRSGHYLAEGLVNGQKVGFLVDTGATDVAISENAARALGLKFGPEITVMTAAGPSRGWMTRLDTVSIGNLELRDVRATIAPGLGGKALLGMSFLSYFNIRQEQGNMIISQVGSEIE